MRVPFSDSDPIIELSIFGAVCLVSLIVVSNRRAKNFFQNGFHRFGQFLLKLPLFEKSSLRAELFKFACLRVVLALTIGHHLLPPLLSAFLEQNWLEVTLNGIGVLLCAFICLGFATPLVSILLALLLSPIIDNFCFSSNLGSVFAQQLLWLFAFGYSGWAFSVDKWLGKKGSSLLNTKRLLGVPSMESITVLKFIVLAFYGLVCWESAGHHVQALTWKSGEICGLILASPTTNPNFYAPFEAFYRVFPVQYAQGFKMITYATLLWMATFPLPLLAGGIIRRLTLLFWLSFILTDSFVLPLMGNLGPVQLICFLVLFSPARMWSFAAEKFHYHRKHHSPAVLASRSVACRNYPLLMIGYTVSMIVFGISFCFRYPAFDSEWLPKGVKKVIALERTTMGQSFLAAGLTFLDVFNDSDRRLIFRLLSFEFLDRNGQVIERTLYWPDALRARFLQFMRSQEFFCYENRQEAVLGSLSAYFHLFEPRLKTLRVHYFYIGEPDFLNDKPNDTMMNKRMKMCTVDIDAETRKFVSANFEDDGLIYAWRKYSRVPSRGTAPLIISFPVSCERAILLAHKNWLIQNGREVSPQLQSLIDFSYNFGIVGPQTMEFLARVCSYYDSQNPEDLSIASTNGDEALWLLMEQNYRDALKTFDRRSTVAEGTAGVGSKKRALLVRKEYFDRIFANDRNPKVQLSSRASFL